MTKKKKDSRQSSVYDVYSPQKGFAAMALATVVIFVEERMDAIETVMVNFPEEESKMGNG